MMRSRSTLAALALMVLSTSVGGSLLSGPGAVAAPPSTQPPKSQLASGQVLVVQANVQDAVRDANAADTADLDHFVDRLLTDGPAAPDALLLTEILGPGAKHVASALSSRTGDSYSVRIGPGRSPWLPDGAVRESAIILNTDTMRAAGRPEFVRVQHEDHAYLPVAQVGSGVRLHLIAGHVAGDPTVAAAELASHLNSRADGADLSVLGADFAVPRCATAGETQQFDCATRPFWTDLTQSRAYDDAAFIGANVPTRSYTNFLFARAQVTQAFMDTAYDQDVPDLAACKAFYDAGRSHEAGPDCAAYYADQPFTWSVVEPGDAERYAVFPTAITMDYCEGNNRIAGVAARVVNGTDAETSTPVRVEAAEPLTVEPAEQTIVVPPGEARDVYVSLAANRSDTPVGDYSVVVHFGSETKTVPVLVPEECHVAPAVATSYQGGYEPEKAVDGDPLTFWHSMWNPPQPLPQSITVNLGEVRSVSTLEYLPRQDGSLNGTILDYNVAVSADGENFTQVADGTWAADRLQKTATFPATDAAFVRLEATRASGPYASAAEITLH